MPACGTPHRPPADVLWRTLPHASCIAMAILCTPDVAALAVRTQESPDDLIDSDDPLCALLGDHLAAHLDTCPHCKQLSAGIAGLY